jgi:hypothetical protein
MKIEAAHRMDDPVIERSHVGVLPVFFGVVLRNPKQIGAKHAITQKFDDQPAVTFDNRRYRPALRAAVS